MSCAGMVCGYCGRMLDGFTGELHVTALKVSRFSDSSYVTFGMTNEYFCDSECLCNAIREIEMVEHNDLVTP